LIVANTATTITATIQISDAALIPGSVNLLQLGATGTQPTILGVMHDDGLNGDAVSGDGIYTLQMSFDWMTAQQIPLQVSAAFRGQLNRVLSTPVVLSVWNTFSDSSGTYSIAYPTGWFVTNSGAAVSFSSTSTPSLEGGPGSEIEVQLLPLGGASSLLQWLQEQYTGEIDISTVQFTSSSGVRFLLVSNLPGLSSDNTGAFVVTGDTVLELSVEPATGYQSTFQAMLNSLELK
jgi:hypothetical protein